MAKSVVELKCRVAMRSIATRLASGVAGRTFRGTSLPDAPCLSGKHLPLLSFTTIWPPGAGSEIDGEIADGSFDHSGLTLATGVTPSRFRWFHVDQVDTVLINLKAAKTLGLTFPQSFHLRADEVIE
jgi:hypothetical protein